MLFLQGKRFSVLTTPPGGETETARCSQFHACGTVGGVTVLTLDVGVLYDTHCLFSGEWDAAHPVVCSTSPRPRGLPEPVVSSC